MAPTAEVAESPIPPEAFERYPGKWVAIRNGNVVGAGDDLAELERNERVESTDTLFLVPDPSAHFYLSRPA